MPTTRSIPKRSPIQVLTALDFLQLLQYFPHEFSNYPVISPELVPVHIQPVLNVDPKEVLRYQ